MKTFCDIQLRNTKEAYEAALRGHQAAKQFSKESLVYTLAAKLQNGKQYSIICNHLGVPYMSIDEKGYLNWSAELDIYGKPRDVVGDKNFMPFRFPGQYYDQETELHYNRFRYYNPNGGAYISQDPIGLAGGNPNIYGYVEDTNGWMDVFGLAGYKKNKGQKPQPLTKREKKKFEEALEKITGGDLDERKKLKRKKRDGTHKTFEKRSRKPHQDKYEGALEFDVVTGDNNYRILELTNKDGEVEHLFSTNHFDDIKDNIDDLKQPPPKPKF